MKKYLSFVIVVLLIMGVLAGCAEQSKTPAQGIASNTNVSDNTLDSLDVKEHSVSQEDYDEEDYEKLLTLQFDDYQHMTISEFQNKVWEMTDTPEYMELLERLSKSETLYRMKDSDETASFLYYVLYPLTAAKWQSWTYSGYAESDLHAPAENAWLEYNYTLTILAADKVMVKDYNDIRLSIEDMMQDILRNRTKEKLQNEAFMLTELQAYVDEMLTYMQTPEVSIAIEYVYFPLPAENDDNSGVYFDDNVEQRRSPDGTEEDYRALLSLKTSDYQDMTLADFNSVLLGWTNENPERMERISEDVCWNDFQVALSDEELSFVKLTVFLSGMENGKAIQSSYAGEFVSPCYGEELPQRRVNRNGTVIWCSLYYQFAYSISDTEMVTVGERDSRIESMINAIRAFWNNTDIEKLLKMNKSDIVQELEKMAAAYGTDYVTITIDRERIHFECMNERQYMD
ncbi:MAG: hypothetical protein NC313_12050 [Butyrivibrio sp.]|nr:hypothetical protein [Butyrivibrio sp.]